MQADFPLPTVHLNGTGRQMLQDDYLAAYEAIENARQALARVEFNARDYYVHSAGAYSQAREKRNQMLTKLQEVQDYALMHCEAVGIG